MQCSLSLSQINAIVAIVPIHYVKLLSWAAFSGTIKDKWSPMSTPTGVVRLKLAMLNVIYNEHQFELIGIQFRVLTTLKCLRFVIKTFISF